MGYTLPEGWRQHSDSSVYDPTGNFWLKQTDGMWGGGSNPLNYDPLNDPFSSRTISWNPWEPTPYEMNYSGQNQWNISPQGGTPYTITGWDNDPRNAGILKGVTDYFGGQESGVRGRLEAIAQERESSKDFGDYLLPAGIAALGAMSGGFGLGSLFSGGSSAASSFGPMAAPTGLAEEMAMLGVGGGGAGAGGLASGAAGTTSALTTPDWLGQLLQSSGEAGVSSAALEGGFNAAASNAPWWSGLPQGGQNLVQGLSKVFGGGGLTGPVGDYKFPWANAIMSALGYFGKRGEAKDLNSLMERMISAADPAAAERPRYQQQTRDLTTNPSSFFKDPAIEAVIQSALDQSNRTLVSQGFNKSGNQSSELTKVAQNEAFKNYLPYLAQIGGFAGLGFPPGNMSGAASAGQAGIGANRDALGNLGVGVGAILKGEQPSYLDVLRGSGTNKTLLDIIRSSTGLG